MTNAVISRVRAINKNPRKWVKCGKGRSSQKIFTFTIDPNSIFKNESEIWVKFRNEKLIK